jgi:thiosulfate dehydrogenase [quinone] large subunit
LLLGVGVRVAGFAGAVLVLLMWSANLPPANNPLIDEHVVYAVLLVGLALVRAGQWYGLSSRFSRVWRTAPALAAILQ